MRLSIIAIGVAAIAATGVAQAQDTGQWQFFEAAGARNGASIKAANGNQLVLKCDKPGSKEVHAILLSANDRIAIPNIRPISRPISFQFDGGSPKTEDWAFYEKYAMAQGKARGQAMAHFVNDLRKATKVKARLSTGIGSDVEMDFDTAGAAAAITKVYEMCKDKAPA